MDFEIAKLVIESATSTAEVQWDCRQCLIHYFAFWGSLCCVLNYSILLITKYSNVTQGETGILYSILPLTLVIAKPLSCAIADKYVIHEWILLVSAFGTALSFGLLIVIPFLTSKSLIWILFCILMLFGQVSIGITISIVDSFVMKISESSKTDFGKLRVWATLGWGSLSLLAGYLNDVEYLQTILPLYVPGILVFMVLQIINCLLFTFNLKKIRKEIFRSRANNQGQEIKLTDKKELRKKKKNKKILKFVILTCKYHPILIKYIFICMVVGILTAVHWNYFPLFLSKLKPDNASNLIGLASLVQCFFGELPFLFFASSFVNKIGTKISFSLVLLAFGLRYLLYSFITTETAYYILVVELFHGLTYGIFYYCLNLVASKYCKKMNAIKANYLMDDSVCEEDESTFASMQGIMSGSFEGIGVAIGSLASGFGIEKLGFKIVWYLTSGLAFTVLLIDLILIICSRKKK